MAGLKATPFKATITWLGRVPDRKADLAAEPVQQVQAGFEGFKGEDHGGLTRPSCSRVKALYEVGTRIRNTRQLSILSVEELAEIAAAMGVRALDPAWLGASMVIEGIPNFTRIPPSSRLQSQSGTTLTVDLENGPCVLPAKVIEEHIPGAGRTFKPSATGLRGVTAWVEREGPLRIGDGLTLHVPDQPAWPHLQAARNG